MAFTPFACNPFTVGYAGATVVKNTDGSYTLFSPTSPNTAYNPYTASLAFQGSVCGTLDVIGRSGGGDVSTPVYIASISRCGATRLTLTNGDAIGYLDSVANTTFIPGFYIRQSRAFTITLVIKDVRIPYNRAAAALPAIEISRANFEGTFFQFGSGNLTANAAGSAIFISEALYVGNFPMTWSVDDNGNAQTGICDVSGEPQSGWRVCLGDPAGATGTWRGHT